MEYTYFRRRYRSNAVVELPRHFTHQNHEIELDLTNGFCHWWENAWTKAPFSCCLGFLELIGQADMQLHSQEIQVKARGLWDFTNPNLCSLWVFHWIHFRVNHYTYLNQHEESPAGFLPHTCHALFTPCFDYTEHGWLEQRRPGGKLQLKIMAWGWAFTRGTLAPPNYSSTVVSGAALSRHGEKEQAQYAHRTYCPCRSREGRSGNTIQNIFFVHEVTFTEWESLLLL